MEIKCCSSFAIEWDICMCQQILECKFLFHEQMQIWYKQVPSSRRRFVVLMAVRTANALMSLCCNFITSGLFVSCLPLVSLCVCVCVLWKDRITCAFIYEKHFIWLLKNVRKSFLWVHPVGKNINSLMKVLYICNTENCRSLFLWNLECSSAFKTLNLWWNSNIGSFGEFCFTYFFF